MMITKKVVKTKPRKDIFLTRVRSTREMIEIIRALIERTPDMLGGSARIVRTRISVWTLENYRRLGWTEDELLRNYPTLRLRDLRAAWDYAVINQKEIDREIERNAKE